jgi:hypothetical protein
MKFHYDREKAEQTESIRMKFAELLDFVNALSEETVD